MQTDLPPGLPVDHLSSSAIGLYADCGRAWQGRYQQKLPEPTTPALVIGNVFDETVEAVLRARLTGHAADPVAVWDELWHSLVVADQRRFRRVDRKTGEVKYLDIDWQGEIPEKVENEGRRLAAFEGTKTTLEQLLPLVEPGGMAALQRRVSLRVPGVPVPIIGYVDLITGAYQVIDIKTAARPWPQGKARKELQPKVYLAALQQERFPLRSLTFTHLVWVKGKEPRIQAIETKFTPAELFAAVEAVSMAWRGITAGVYVPNPGSWRCGEGCAVWRAGQCLGAR